MDFSKHTEAVKTAAAVLAFLVLVGIGALISPTAIDIDRFFRPAVQAVFSGIDPYQVEGFFSPPWLIPFLTPLLLPDSLGRGLFLALTILVTVWALRCLEADLLPAALFLTTPFWVIEMMSGNVDWLPLLGISLPLPMGLPLMLLKPQFAIGVIFFRLWQTWKEGQGRGVVRAVWPTVLVMGISFLIYPHWLQSLTGAMSPAAQAYGLRFFPWSVPIGFFALIYSVREGRIKAAYPVGLSALMCHPTLGMYSS